MKFVINEFYKNNQSGFSTTQINEAVEIALILINEFKNNKIDVNKFELIGEGNSAGGKVYQFVGTKFCMKISKLGKHVGSNQEKQFILNQQCSYATKGKFIEIEDEKYNLDTIHTIAVCVHEEFAYTIMPFLENTVRLWDEENIHFKDKDSWDAIREIKSIVRNYAKNNNLGEESFLGAMEIIY